MALRSSSSLLLTLHASDHNTSDYHVFVSRCYCFKSNYIIIVIYFVRGMVWRGLVVVMWGSVRCGFGMLVTRRVRKHHHSFFAWWCFSTLHEQTFLSYLNDVIQFMLFSHPPPLGWCCSLAPCCGVVVLSCLLRLDGGAFPSAVIGWWCSSVLPSLSSSFWVVALFPSLHCVALCPCFLLWRAAQLDYAIGLE